MVNEVMKFIISYGKEVGGTIEVECARRRRNLELVASGNVVSEPVMMVMGTVLTNKYAEGYSGKHCYDGCERVDVVETLAVNRAKELFGYDYANVQPHSDAQTNMAVFVVMLKPGDTVMDMNLDHGDCLTRGGFANFFGLYFNIVPCGVSDEGYIDYSELERIAVKSKPKLIITRASACTREIGFKHFREVTDKVGACLMVDMAHIADLMATGQHPSPIPYAHMIAIATHKTLRGPRGGVILANQEAASRFNFNKAIFPETQGGLLEHVIAGKTVYFGEALKSESETYQGQVVKNAKVLAEALKKQGLKPSTDGTNNHLMLTDLRGMDVSGKEPQNRYDEVYITLNKNTVPNDPRSPSVTSDVRMGTLAITSRGLEEESMERITEYIWLTITDFKAKADCVCSEVTKIYDKYPVYQQDTQLAYEGPVLADGIGFFLDKKPGRVWMNS